MWHLHTIAARYFSLMVNWNEANKWLCQKISFWKINKEKRAVYSSYVETSRRFFSTLILVFMWSNRNGMNKYDSINKVCVQNVDQVMSLFMNKWAKANMEFTIFFHKIKLFFLLYEHLSMTLLTLWIVFHVNIIIH